MNNSVESLQALRDLAWLANFFENHENIAEVAEIRDAISDARTRAQNFRAGDAPSNLLQFRKRHA